MFGLIVSFIIGSLILAGLIWINPYLAEQHKVIVPIICIALSVLCYGITLYKIEDEFLLFSNLFSKKDKKLNDKAGKTFYGSCEKTGDKQVDEFEKARFFFATNRNKLGRELLESIAKYNDSAYALLGYAIACGLYGYKQNVEKGLKYLDEALENGNSYASVYYYYLYKDGEVVKENQKKADKFLQGACAKENPLALIEEGLKIYKDGDKSKEELDRAENLFRKAHTINPNYGYEEIVDVFMNTDSGLSKEFIYESYLLLMPKTANCLLLRARALLEFGKYKKAVKILNRLVEDGDEDAMLELAWQYMMGDKLEKNSSLAIYYYNYCNKKNNAESYFQMGFGYYSGLLAEKDFEKAKSYFVKAEEYGLSGMPLWLGRVEEKLYNYKSAESWFKKGAENGDVVCATSLANLYETRLNNLSKAIEFYKEAINLGDYEASCQLGILYLYKKKDRVNGLKYLTLAGENGIGFAYFKLGKCYFEGDGFVKDYNLAFKYFTKAAEQEESEAQALLGSMYLNGHGCKKDFSKAFYWIQKSALNDNPRGQSYLAGCYEHGWGCGIDLEKAKYWNEKMKETFEKMYADL